MTAHELRIERGDSPNGPFILARCTCGAVATFNGRNDKRDLFDRMAPKQAGHWHERHTEGAKA